MSNLTGSAPYQIPTNADLGTMAFQDLDPLTSSSSTRKTITSGDSSAVIMDQFSIWECRTAKYVVQAQFNANVYASEILLTHDGSNVYTTEYGRLTNQTSTPLAAFSANIANDMVNLRFTNTTGGTVTVTSSRLAINL
jgi:hypothetical protein